jgi:hypothetical protein
MLLDALHATLGQRRRPEDVADLIARQLGDRLERREKNLLDRAARGALRRQAHGYTSMLEAFAGPVGLGPQIARATQLFRAATAGVGAHDAAAIRALIATCSAEIGKGVGASDFLHHRLNGDQRRDVGILDSRRRYNRKFRLLRRLEDKLLRLVDDQEKYDMTRVGKSALATRIPRDELVASESAACFAAYYTARCNLRTAFVITGQTRPFDDIAAMLFERCKRDPATSWWVVAQVYPVGEVLERLDEHQKLALLATWLEVLHRLAARLEAIWSRSRFDLATMTVRPGDDSSTWNQLAQAWNRARDGWISVVYAVGAEDVLDRLLPGKVMRLVAADLAAWHRSVGHTVEPNTQVWSRLPRPWSVLRGEKRCTRAMVERACATVGLDPERTGWIAPRPPARPVAFAPTPELVHGVAVSHPHLAKVLRDAGFFSGKQPGAAIN